MRRLFYASAPAARKAHGPSSKAAPTAAPADAAETAPTVIPLRPQETTPEPPGEEGVIARPAAHEPAAPSVEDDAATRLEGPAEARIRESDAAFHRTHLRGLGLLWSNLWIALGAGAAAAAGFSSVMVEPLAALGAAAALSALIYSFIAAVAGQRLGYAHERAVADIRRVASLGAERLRVDDPELVPGALRDVLSEWMHSALFLRRLRQTSTWYRLAVSLQAGLTALAVAGLALLSPLALAETAVLAGAALLLTAVHWRREIRQGRERAAACALGETLDPTEAVSQRMATLLREVKALRRRARD